MFTAIQFRTRALQFVGRVPYVLGAQWTSATKAPGLPRAVDCSELVEGLFRENGTPFPVGDPTAAGLYDHMKPVTGAYRPGDCVFLKNNPARANGIGHVGILVWGSKGLDADGYIAGEPEIVEARGRAYGCQKHTLAFWRARGTYAGVRRWPGFKLADQKPRTILRKGDTGNDVKAMQIRLIKAGFSCGPDGPDGDFGTNTEKAVKACQTKAGFTGQDIDGEFGPKTNTALTNMATAHGRPGTPVASVAAPPRAVVRLGAANCYSPRWGGPPSNTTKRAEQLAAMSTDIYLLTESDQTMLHTLNEHLGGALEWARLGMVTVAWRAAILTRAGNNRVHDGHDGIHGALLVPLRHIATGIGVDVMACHARPGHVATDMQIRADQKAAWALAGGWPMIGGGDWNTPWRATSDGRHRQITWTPARGSMAKGGNHTIDAIGVTGNATLSTPTWHTSVSDHLWLSVPITTAR